MALSGTARSDGSRERSETIKRVDKTLRVLNSGSLRGHFGRDSLASSVSRGSDSDSSDDGWDTDLECDGVSRIGRAYIAST
jgi:hypothetical protein